MIRRRRSQSRLPLGCGAIAGPVFMAVFSIAGHRRPGYDARRHPVSALALGPGGWVQRADFVVTGSLYLAGSLGLARTRRLAQPGPVLIAAAGVGLIGSGLYDTDPVGGYPPGSSPEPAAPTRGGARHNLCALPIFAGIPAAALLSAATSRDAAWAAYSSASAGLMLGSFALAGQGFAQNPRFAASGGVLQRVSIASGYTWLTALHLRAA